MTTGNMWNEWKGLMERLYYEKGHTWTSVLESVESKSGLKRTHITLGLKLLIGFYLIAGHGRGLVCNIIGFLYPAYASIKAIESENKDDDTKWLTYWVVYSIFSLFEFFSDIFLAWMPFYWLLKCLFLVFCMAPLNSNGSTLIYKRIILPLFIKHQHIINKVVDSSTAAGTRLFEETKETLTNATKTE